MPKFIRIIIFLCLLTWCAGIFFEMFIPFTENLIYVYPFVKKAYSLVCHQDSSKLINFLGYKTLTCSRCTGIYVGALALSFINLFFPLKRNLKIKFLFFAMLPIMLDIFLYTIGAYNYIKEISFITGILLGSAGILYFYNGILNYLIEIKTRRKEI